VTRAIESGKTVTFRQTGCEFKNNQGQITAVATKQGSLYHLKMCSKSQKCLNTIVSESKERMWHQRFGHVNKMSRQKLVKK